MFQLAVAECFCSLVLVTLYVAVTIVIFLPVYQHLMFQSIRHIVQTTCLVEGYNLLALEPQRNNILFQYDIVTAGSFATDPIT